MTHLVRYWWSPQLSFSPPLSLSSSVLSHPGPPVVSCRGYDARTLHFCTYCRYRTNDERCKKMIRISLKLLLHYSCFRKIVVKFVSLRMQGFQVRTKSLIFLSWMSVTQSLSSKSVKFLPWSCWCKVASPCDAERGWRNNFASNLDLDSRPPPR